ncbi:MAG: ATP-binding cassette domain-containing protein [Butyrivibrio sp.]|nr:ATP-binding cassette domain-containing protein [Butyrivibrio sp.]
MRGNNLNDYSLDYSTEVKVLIKVNDIVKVYGEHIAVNHLSYTFEKGQIYGFLGPNGAGKSTTMNIMTGYIAASSGSVTINDFDILKDPENAKKNIGYLPEIPPLYTDMTIEEYLRFVAELKKVPKKEIRDQLAKVMSMTKIGDYGKRMIKNLSKGYKQRVGLAGALVGFPEVIILDEPTVGLDPQQIIEIRELIRSLKDDHIVILSSHILSEISEVCDQIIIISHGKLVESGTPSELEGKYNGNQKIKISILGEKENIQNALEQLDIVKDIVISDTKDSQGAVSVEIETKDNSEDNRNKIALCLASASLPVISMSVETKTLEDVFLAVTNETPAFDSVKKKKARKDAKKIIKESFETSEENADTDTSEITEASDEISESESNEGSDYVDSDNTDSVNADFENDNEQENETESIESSDEKLNNSETEVEDDNNDSNL